jgi:hypothetical protein
MGKVGQKTQSGTRMDSLHPIPHLPPPSSNGYENDAPKFRNGKRSIFKTPMNSKRMEKHNSSV